MHELSIASSILAIAQQHVPPHAVLKAVHLVAGPMRAIEPDAMQFAWQAVLADAGLEHVQLELKLLPWTLRCPVCGGQWTSPQLDSLCAACGSDSGFPVGGDDLQVISIQVDDEPVSKGAVPCETFLLSKM